MHLLLIHETHTIITKPSTACEAFFSLGQAWHNSTMWLRLTHIQYSTHFTHIMQLTFLVIKYVKTSCLCFPCICDHLVKIFVHSCIYMSQYFINFTLGCQQIWAHSFFTSNFRTALPHCSICAVLVFLIFNDAASLTFWSSFGGDMATLIQRWNRATLNSHLIFDAQMPKRHLRNCLHICPISWKLETKPQMVLMDLNISFQWLALIQGQMCNLEFVGLDVPIPFYCVMAQNRLRCLADFLKKSFRQTDLWLRWISSHARPKLLSEFFFQLQGVKYTRGNLLILKPFTWICWFRWLEKKWVLIFCPQKWWEFMVMTFPWDRIHKKSPKHNPSTGCFLMIKNVGMNNCQPMDPMGYS